MEINTSELISNTLNTSAIKVEEPKTTSTTPEVTESTSTSSPQKTDTVSFSSAAIARSSTDNESTKVGPKTNIDPQEKIDQLQSSIDQDPSQAIHAQAGKVTDTAVKSLLG